MVKRINKGFTLIELMIVVVIISIVAAIAVPSFLRSRLSAQEASAIAALRTIATAQAEVQSKAAFTEGDSGIGLYGSFLEMASLDPPALDVTLTTPPHQKHGYEFTLDFSEQSETEPYYEAFARPLTPGTNPRYFYTNPSGVIRYTTDGSVPGSTSQSL